MKQIEGSKVYDTPAPEEATIRWDLDQISYLTSILLLGDYRQLVPNDEVEKLYEGLMSFKQHGDHVTVDLPAIRGDRKVTVTIMNDEQLAIRYEGAKYEYICHPAEFLFITEKAVEKISAVQARLPC